MDSGHVQDALLETDHVQNSRAHEHLERDNGSTGHSIQNYAERENKRTRQWTGRWSSDSNYDRHPLSRTYHRDNIRSSWSNCNSHPPEEFYGHPMTDRTEQRCIRESSNYNNYNRYPLPRNYHREYFTNSRQSYEYHGHRYYGSDTHSTEHHVRHYPDREKNGRHWDNWSSSYDRQPQPWTNRRENTSYQSPLDEHHRSYGGRNHLSSRERHNRFSAKEDSGTYYRRGIVASRLQTESKPVFIKNEWVKKTESISLDGNSSLKQQIVEKSETLEQEVKQAIERSSVYEKTTIGVTSTKSEGDTNYSSCATDAVQCAEMAILNNGDNLLEVSHSPLEMASTPCLRKKLLILDVNGLLADVIFPPPKVGRADINICRRAIFKRPCCDDFLKFCFQRFDVGIWSSRTKTILDGVVDYLLGDMKSKLLFCWDQSHCTKTGFKTLQNKHKELFLKELKKVWENHDANLSWQKGDYDESNTLLVDDSPYKALLNPMHTAIFPHPYSFEDKSDTSLGPEGDLRLYLQDLAASLNVRKYVEEHPFGQTPIDETSSSWAFYLEVISSQSLMQSQS